MFPCGLISFKGNVELQNKCPRIWEFRIGELRFVMSGEQQYRFVVPHGFKEVLSGSFAGVVGTFFGHPLDLIKVRFFSNAD